MFSDNKKNNQSGFTLLEVIISIAVLAIGVLAVAKMQAVAVRGTTLANQMTEDALNGQDIIERIVAANYTHDSLTDVNGDGQGGLNDRGASADYSLDSNDGNYYTGWNNAGWNFDTNNEIFSISWNVWETPPTNDTKTIRMIIESFLPEGQKVQIYDFIKSDLP